MLRFCKKRMRLYVLALAISLVSSPLTRSQVSTNVPVTRDEYRNLDRLNSFGLLDDYLYGMRPYSRSEFARLIVEARTRLQEQRINTSEGEITGQEVEAVEQTISDLESLFSSEIHDLNGEVGKRPWQVEMLRNLTVEQNYLDSPSRHILEDIRWGEIDAFVNPLYAHHDGKRFVRGANSYLQFENRIRGFGLLSVDFTPYLYIGVPKDNGKSERDFAIQRLSVKIGLRDVELQLGRDQVIWGQGELGGVLLSNNPRPFDLIKLSTIHPLQLPGILRHLGPSAGSIFVARLGKDRTFPHAALIGFSVLFKPLSSLEFGLYHTYLFGGRGAPESDLLDPVAEFFFIRRHGEAFDDPGSPNLADHRAGIQFRFDVAALRHTKFYFEWMWDDFVLKILHNSAFLVGIHVPRLDFTGKTGLRIEFRSLARILYRHYDFRTGYADDGLIIGDPLGPKARALSVGLTREISRPLFLESLVSYEDYRGVRTPTVNLEGEHERRLRTIFALRLHLPSGWTVKGSAGYEHVWKFNFEPEMQRDNVRFELGLEFPF